MALPTYACRNCSTVWATWLSRCGRCHEPNLEVIMPKISAAGGSTHSLRREVASSLGNSSEVSGPMQPMSLPKSEFESQKPAQTTEPPSNPDQTESDSVDSTAGSTPETGTVPLPEVPLRNASKAKWVEFAEAVGLEGAADLTRDELVDWWDRVVEQG